MLVGWGCCNESWQRQIMRSCILVLPKGSSAIHNNNITFSCPQLPSRNNTYYPNNNMLENFFQFWSNCCT